MTKFNKYKQGATVITIVYMSVEDVGCDIPVGTQGKIFAEPSDDEELVGVAIDNTLHYLPQNVLKVSKIGSVIGKLRIQTIPENALLDRVIRELEGREAFKDADPNNNERIYHGDVFEAILNEFGELEGTPMYPQKKVMEQLEELSIIIRADYVLVTLS